MKRRERTTEPKRQRTEWIWRYEAAKGTYIHVGWIHNKAGRFPEDKVRVKAKMVDDCWDVTMRIDEALALVGGIGKVLCQQTLKDRIVLKPERKHGPTHTQG